MHIGYNGSRASIRNAGRSNSSRDDYGSWMEVGVDEDGSGYLYYYEVEPTGSYEGVDSGDNFTLSTLLMPWPQRSAWIGIFALMLVVAIAGNALVTWIVIGLYFLPLLVTLIVTNLLYVNGIFSLAHRRMKTVTNYFLVSRFGSTYRAQ